MCGLLQVLDLSQCGIQDAGGAALCSAMLQQNSLQELHLSWNALSQATAKALEAVLRCAVHGISPEPEHSRPPLSQAWPRPPSC